MPREYTEEDVRVRPQGRKSRPRSKDRPEHRDARPGLVLTVDRGRFRVVLADDGTRITAVRARELGRRGIVVGDRVGVSGDTSGTPGSLARIVRVDKRSTALRRTPDDDDATERIVVANAEILGVVVAAADPAPRERFIDRCLVAALDAGLEPLLIVTKTDLDSADDLAAGYRALGMKLVRTSAEKPVTELTDLLTNRTTVLIGQSGVGKSTLVNRLVPEADREIGAVNEVTGRGRHTSTSAVGLSLPGGGWIIDTPGLRSFGLGHIDPGKVLEAFGELADGAAGCPRGCDHLPPHCALDAWVASGGAGPAGEARLESLRRLLRSLSSQEIN